MGSNIKDKVNKNNHQYVNGSNRIENNDINNSNYIETDMVLRSLSAFNKRIDPIILTESQENTVNMCIRLIPDFKILVIKGESLSGKNVVAKEFFKRIGAVVEYFDLCELAKTVDRTISNQDLVEYFECLIKKLNIRMEAINPNVEKLKNKKNKIPGIIYIRYYNRIADVLTDCYAKSRFLLPLILKTISETMPNDVRIVMSTQGCILPEGLHWCTELITTRSDMEHILLPFRKKEIISQEEFNYIMKISKVIPVGRILHCLKYAISMTRHLKEIPIDNCVRNEQNIYSDNKITCGYEKWKEEENIIESSEINNRNNRNNQNISAIEKSLFIEAYCKGLSKFSGSTVDIDKDVPSPIPEDDLVGVEDIIDEITTSIINPMKLNIPGIALKKGLLLCGPPGTGKTSIGRWLAHQVKGKFYLIGGEAGISGNTLLDAFHGNVRKARENAPAVVFIDDADVLFDQDDTYRAFLTILDGIETNKRTDVCVIVTCMNMRKVPASLIRGGRLEMALITRLPDERKIRIILERSLNKMVVTLSRYNIDISNLVSSQIHKEFIFNISSRMSGWNCADIHRCVNDVSRLLISNKGTNMWELFNHCIKQIIKQYTLCGRCESTNLDDRSYDSYIS
jgi:SpoVK/Ycf46/Vps4 family AAA+-type ATPase